MTTPTTQIDVYIMKPGELYEDLRRYCPNDHFELTSHSLTVPNGIVILAKCPIDDLKVTILSEITALASPIFTLFSIYPNIKKQVDETIAAISFIMVQWIQGNPNIPPDQASFIVDTQLNLWLYNQSKLMGLTSEIPAMPPQA